MISTAAPAASSLPMISSASSLATPSLMAAGADSTNLFGLAQAERSDLTHGLNDIDLVGADFLEVDFKFRLLFGGGGTTTVGGPAGCGCGGDRHRGRGADAKLSFQGLHHVGQLHDIHLFDRV